MIPNAAEATGNAAPSFKEIIPILLMSIACCLFSFFYFKTVFMLDTEMHFAFLDMFGVVLAFEINH